MPLSTGRSNLPLFLSPTRLYYKAQEWIYDSVKLFLSLICSVSCVFCVLTFIWYLTFRGLYGFIANIQLNSSDNLDMGPSEYRPGKRKSFLTRVRELKAQADLAQLSLKKKRTTEQSSTGISLKVNGKSLSEEKLCNHVCQNDTNHTLLLRNSSYVSEVYYDGNGHKIGEQIYLTNDSDGLEESYFEVKVNDVQHLKELGGGVSTSALVNQATTEDEETVCKKRKTMSPIVSLSPSPDPMLLEQSTHSHADSDDGLEEEASDQTRDYVEMRLNDNLVKNDSTTSPTAINSNNHDSNLTFLKDPTDGLEQLPTETDTTVASSSISNDQSDTNVISPPNDGQTINNNRDSVHSVRNNGQTTLLSEPKHRPAKSSRRRRKNKANN